MIRSKILAQGFSADSEVAGDMGFLLFSCGNPLLEVFYLIRRHYGAQEIGSVTGVANPETIIVCNENLSNLDLPEGVIIDANLRNSLFTARDYPYTVGKTGEPHRVRALGGSEHT